jgi:ParB family chromosome partitioning protein
MGRLNLSSFSELHDFCSEQEQKISVKRAEPTELQKAYTDVWGSSYEKVESLDINIIQHYKDKNGNSQPFTLNEEKINQIMASAEDVGIITPLIVRRLSGNMKYEIIEGHHRYEAAKRLKMLSVPCVVRNLTDEEAFKIVAESNIQRNQTLPSEYGKIFTAYMNKRGDVDMTAAEIAAKFGVSPKTMYRYINVANMIDPLQKCADSGIINLAAADIISGFSEGNQRLVWNFINENSDFKKITPAVAKQFAAIVDAYGGDDVPDYELIKFFEPKPKVKYKSGIYNNLSSSFQFDKTDLSRYIRSYERKYIKCCDCSCRTGRNEYSAYNDAFDCRKAV